MSEKKQTGRPKGDVEFKKRTIMMDDELYKALQIKAISEGKDVSEIIRLIIRANIEEKYYVSL